MNAWAPDLFALIGLLLWGAAAYRIGGEIALLAYAGVVCLMLAGAIAWKRST